MPEEEDVDFPSPSTPPGDSSMSRRDPKEASVVVVLGGGEEVAAVVGDVNFVRRENASPVEAINSRDADSARPLMGTEFIMIRT
jgi:hypothetical protein